jgi:hypothetical protein
MGRQRSVRDSYTGRGGQNAVLAELLMRRCNAAVPEVDEGDDLVTFLTGHPAFAFLQVKTANAEPLQEEGRYAARVSVPLDQLHEASMVELIYVFVVRLRDRWTDFVFISRDELRVMSGSQGVGYVNHRAKELQLYLSFGPASLTCSEQDWQGYRNAWRSIPLPWPGDTVPPAQAAPGSEGA